MPRVVARVKDRTLAEWRRAQIVLAARAVFREKGFHKSTVRDIGRAADVTQGTLYNYIRTKEDILFLICDELVNTYRALIQKVIELHPSPEQRLRAALEGLIQIIHEHQDNVLLMDQESHSLPRKALRHVLSRVGSLIEEFAELVKNCSVTMNLPPTNSKLVANIVTFLPAIVALRRWELRRCSKHPEVVHELIEFMMRGLGLKAVR